MTRAFALLLTAARCTRCEDRLHRRSRARAGRRSRSIAATLTRLGRVEEMWTSRGTTRRVSGVPLQKILAEVGVEPGAMGKDLEPGKKRLGLRQAVVVTARDGFQAVFSVGELWPGLGPTRVLVVDRVDGKPLDADGGSATGWWC